MKELLTEGTVASINTQIPSSTDDVISQYENKLIQSIASKTLSASKKGVVPVFSKEESAYLTKKSFENGQLSEVKVITPDPTITLKKGNTEISIKNAATLVKKMEELYPNGMTEDSSDNIRRQPFIKASIEHGLKEQEKDQTYQEFKTRVNFPVKNVSSAVKNSVDFDESVQTSFFSTSEKPHVEKSVNKNAYEIRESILGMALNFFKWQIEMKCNVDKQNGLVVDGSTLKFTADDVLNTANKFYKFVENRR